MDLRFIQADINKILKLRSLISAQAPSNFEGALNTLQIDFLCEKLYMQHLLHQSDKSAQSYVIAASGDYECGYGSFIPQGEDLFFMSQLFICADMRQKGIGAALFREICRLVRETNQRSCSLEIMINSHSPAYGFYQRLGMQKIREYSYNLDMNLVISQDILSISL